MRNVGGTDGAGLCVFTSVQHAGYWQNIPALDGFRRFMEGQPGGGWPEKLDDMIARFCKKNGATVPSYIQHTGGDDHFLDLALHTDRIVCVTYAGSDDFYRGGIDHMVNLAHLDATRAAIIDNNRPGTWLWMSRTDFLSRWRARGGGWAVVFLASPPPSHPANKAATDGCDCCKPKCDCEKGKRDKDCVCYPCKCNQKITATPCICGENCKCKEGECPSKCPVRRIEQRAPT